MMLDPTSALIVAVLLGPVAATYDFLTNPHAPPQIFAAQFEDGFGRPPTPIIPRPPIIRPHKRVIVTRDYD